MSTTATRLRQLMLIAAVLLWTACASSPVGTGAVTGQGVIVDKVDPAGAGFKAGIETGDHLLSWSRSTGVDPDQGRFASIWDYRDAEIEQGARGAVRIVAERDGQPTTGVLEWGEWGLLVRPSFGPGQLRDFEQAMQSINDGHLSLGARGLGKMAGLADPSTAPWLYLIAADKAAGEDRELASALGRKAITSALASEAPAIEARVLQGRGRRAEALGEYQTATDLYQSALRAREKDAVSSLTGASVIHDLAILSKIQGLLNTAEAYYHQSLEIRQSLAPASLQVAHSCSNLGNVLRLLGDLAGAERSYQKALEIRQRIKPGTQIHALSLNTLGIITADRGDFAQSESFMQRALEVRLHYPDGRYDLASSYNSLGFIANERYNLEAAQRWYGKALSIWQEIEPEGRRHIMILLNLANLAQLRGDLEKADTLYHEALTILEREPEQADKVLLGGVLDGLAQLAMETDDSSAESYLQRALDIKQTIAPESLLVADTLDVFGELHRKRGRLEQSAHSFRHALELRRRLCPKTLWLAGSAHSLAKVLRDQGKNDEALLHFEEAVEAIEAQLLRLGGTDEDRTAFRSQVIDLYRDYIDLLVKSGSSERAFKTLEQSRGRELLVLLSERDLVWQGELPDELARRWRQARIKHQRASARLSEISEDDGEKELDQARQQLEDSRRQFDEVRLEVTEASPRLANLTDPAPFGLAEVAEILDPGTILAAWSVGETSSYLFLISVSEAGDASLEVLPLQLSENQLRQDISWFRQLGVARSSRRTTAELKSLALELGNALFGSAVHRVQQAQRLIVLPDGPLYQLPFAALRLTSDSGWLIENLPVSTISSATLLGQIRRRESPPSAIRVAAFGDPAYSQEATTSAASRRILPRLPATRQEVLQLGAVYPDSSELFLGSDATEERVLGLPRMTSILHLATHALVDPLSPLDSAIVLSSPVDGANQKNDGMLHAWEVFEQLQIDADLVTLSACESALGQERGGEGIVGLSRAFHFAGARTVLSSLWSVADESTARLMGNFYRGLRQGQPKDEALRQAQLELIRSPTGNGQDTSRPYSWAAFELIGDWR